MGVKAHSVKVTMAYLQKFWKIAPEYCDHIRFLSKYASPNRKEIQDFQLRTQTAMITNNKQKMTDAFKLLIKSQLKAAGITFVMENLPQYAERQCDGKIEKITGKSMHDTMKQFGSVKDVVVFKNHAYVWFNNVNDSNYTHALVNNMMIGNNIVSTAVVA